MTWDIFSLIGTAAFAISGAIVAMEEDFDMFGVYILGMVTAFGGGTVRNLVIGIPVSVLWEQGLFFTVASVLIAVIFFFSGYLLKTWNRWGAYFDAIGLAAFAIQGALMAVRMDMPLFAVVAAAVLTGAGGGVIRDLLAGRQPLIFKSDIYAVWAALAGLIVGFDNYVHDAALYVLLAATAALRMLSIKYHWQLPQRSLLPK
ncbi:trimeric intracellular cation channel family protein [Sporosarcina trichiuri]|uniref:trimeric intracellular cation channel family protein n=1 Tax=Sporosarcina trichiuri TaxID=3056445 RepID=UPI0025B445F3|nr:trimeric intracellular cation channel family protein [Sporosarcina sp. 0.2-SM1T-5]WJY28659.1 trimeric intracellular cation channel family protein [Sporosarcina sp. 0.2-SM1T-5]